MPWYDTPMPTFEDKSRKLKILNERAEERFVEKFSEQSDIPYINLQGRLIEGNALRFLPEAEAREHKMIPYEESGKTIAIAARNPSSEPVKELVQKIQNQGYTTTVAIASTKSIEKALTFYKDLSLAKKTTGGSIAVSDESVEALLSKVSTVEGVKKEIDDALLEKAATSRLLELTVSGALALGASDIHYEPEAEAVRLRYRLDGILIDITNIPSKVYTFVLPRVILISGLRLNERQNAQDGRFSIKLKEKEVEMRVSIIPGNYNNSIVMRILDPDSIQVSLDDLGFHPYLLNVIKSQIAKPNGLILNTGPTGSGKTTSLYSFLREINSPDVKIITIEDPVEYHLDGVVQTQVNKKHDYTFLSGLRSTLRQDPDVVMVGEIRDHETAQIAVDAALTGHLVFSTLHTNSAFGTVPRFQELGINPKTLGSALTLALAQRLVRKLCDCKKEVPLEGELYEKIMFEIERVPELYRKDLQTTSHFVPGKCERCGGRGYKGRVGIFEAIKTCQLFQVTVL